MSRNQSQKEPQDRHSTVGDAPGSLRRFVRPRVLVEHCDLCNAAVADEHPHLIELDTRDIVCACHACAVLSGKNPEQLYRRIPDRIRYLADFQMTDAEWESLLIPNGVAFFVYNSARGKVIALYPSPAGPMESLLTLESWNEVVRCNPILNQMEPDTEALLVNRVGSANDAYLVPVDQCYALVGLVRTRWRGLSGGTEVWEAIAKFFATLSDRAQCVREKGNA